MKIQILCLLCVSAGLFVQAAHTAYTNTHNQQPGIVGDINPLGDAARGSDAENDSIMAVNADQSYRQFTTLRAQSNPDEDYHNQLYACFTDNYDVLSHFAPNTPEYNRARNVLLDINRDLEAAAYFYSAANNQDKLTKFAAAYLDSQIHPAMKGETFKRDNQSFPTMVYIAASGAYNSKDFARAIEYFKLFMECGDNPLREKVYMYMGQACLNTGNYELAVSSLLDAIKLFPENYHLATFGIKACVDGGHAEHLQEFLDVALRLQPADETLLNIQGKLLEDEQQYLKALDVYRKLDELKPNTMSVAQHTALCYYNLGVSYFNQAIMEADEKRAKLLKRQSNDYFSSAIDKLEEVVANSPTSEKYLKALAVAYGCIDEKDKFEELNKRIRALGKDPVESFSMPPIVAYSEKNTTNYSRAGDDKVAPQSSDVPLYSDYARNYVEKALSKWIEKGEFEKVEDYQKRVNDVTIKTEYDKACAAAQNEYLEKYARMLRLNDLTLRPYDAGNEVYLIESSYGPIYLKVPLKDNEAALFKSNWAGVHFKTPKYYIADNEVRVSEITFVTPYGKHYTYNNSDALAYQQQKVDVDFNSILLAANANAAKASNANNSKSSGSSLKITRTSDVDENIPAANRRSDRTLALIISNENYHNVSPVEAAAHDGDIFAKYCNQTLGIPSENIRHYSDATLGTMLRAITQIKNAADALDGDCDIIVYYAGHGVPDERTKDAFLLPVDGEPTTTESCYPLSKFYEQLGSAGRGSVYVFMDACFSGARRDGGMLAQARGVAIKPKDVSPTGNMFILSAASGQETALPYHEKNHGLFTYYLLKKLQDSKGEATLKSLSDDVISNVRKQSTLINNKPQTPQVSVSGTFSSDWQNRKLHR